MRFNGARTIYTSKISTDDQIRTQTEQNPEFSVCAHSLWLPSVVCCARDYREIAFCYDKQFYRKIPTITLGLVVFRCVVGMLFVNGRREKKTSKD